MIKYQQGSMFTAPETDYLLHACNNQGIWRSGVAAQFAQLFPKEYSYYTAECKGRPLAGYCFSTGRIICLVTSQDYGKNRDSVDVILRNTERALSELAESIPSGAVIHAPKINSGLFGVPWEFTETLIESFLKVRTDISFTVWELFDSPKSL